MLRSPRPFWLVIAFALPLVAITVPPSHAVGATGPAVLTGSLPTEVANGLAHQTGSYNPDQMLRLVLGLQPSDPAGEQQFLSDVQNRKSPLFHQFLTADQWNTRFAPAASDEQAVVDWAQAHGLSVTQRYPNRLVVDVQAPVHAIEAAFNVKINTYSVNGKSVYSNDRGPTLPANLVGIVQSVIGMDSIQEVHPEGQGVNQNPSFPVYTAGPAEAVGASMHRDGNRSALPAGGSESPNVTGGYYDPTDLYNSNAYGFDALNALGKCCYPNAPAGETSTPPETSIAIATAGDFSDNDIAQFANRYTYLAYNYNHVAIDGTPSCCNDETTLDTEWSMAIGNSFGCYCTTPHQWVYVGANTHISTFIDIYNHILSDGHVRIMTTSWGCTEIACQSASTMNTQENIFNSMVGQGYSLTAATGDQGAYDDCTTSTPKVQFPSTSPDVVAAGGTELNAFGAFVSEAAWTGPGTSCGGNAGGGGGGCSVQFSAPSYQSNLPCGAGSRGTPDVSFNAYYGENTYFNGGWGGFGGTSIVAPELSGFFAQVNAILLWEGNICGINNGTLPCAPMGNPNWGIYNAALGNGAGTPPDNPFYDVTKGCNGNGAGTGYCAGSGYDLATGWGSFNALQMARDLVWQTVADIGLPSISFSGPATGAWYRTDQTVSWTVTDGGGGFPPSGVQGFSQSWDSNLTNPTSHATPGCCDTFWNGPQFPNATGGSLKISQLPSASQQGCHTAHVESWDYMGLFSGQQTYGKICYDTIAPSVTTKSFSPSSPSNAGSVTMNGGAFDPGSICIFPCNITGSGVNHITYYINTASNGTNSGTWNVIGTSSGSSGSVVWNTSTYADGTHLAAFDPTDNAGNSESCFPPLFTDTCTSFVLDRVAPSTAVQLNGAAPVANYTAPVLVTLSATDATSGVAHTYYTLDGGATQTYSAAFTVNTNHPSPHTVTYWSVDNAGNTESTHTVNFSVQIALTVATAAPAGMSGTTATLKGTVNLNGLAAGCANFIYYPQGNPGGAVTTANQSITGSGTISVSQAISGLSKGTVYLSRLNVADGACAGSGLSTTSGSLLPFLTPIDVPAGWSLLGIPSTEDTSMASAVFGDLNGAGALNGHATILAVYRNGRYLLYIPGYTQDFVLRFGEALAVLSTDSVAHSWAPGGSILTSGGTHTMPHGWNIVAPVRAAMTEQAICSQIGASAQVVVPLGGSSYVCGSGTGALIPNMQGVFVQMATDGSWTQP